MPVWTDVHVLTNHQPSVRRPDREDRQDWGGNEVHSRTRALARRWCLDVGGHRCSHGYGSGRGIDMRMDMCIDKRVNMCVDMCVDMCMDKCIDMCMDI